MLAFWTPERERAYAMVLSGMGLGEIARQLRINPKTLFDWRRSAEWEARWAEDIGKLRELHRDELQAVQTAAVAAMQAHVTKDGHVALEVLHRMGVLPKPADVLKHVGGREAIKLDVRTKAQSEAQAAALVALELARKALGREAEGGVL